MATSKSRKLAHVYLNFATYLGTDAVKVGYSVNPESRLSGFNCGCRWRKKLGHSQGNAIFAGFFRSTAMPVEDCRQIESKFKSKNARLLIADLGVEVFSIDPLQAAEKLCALIESEGLV